MGKHIYEGHMGNFFATNEKWDYDQLYCETCGDSDTYIGYAENAEEAWKLLRPHTNTFDDSVCEGCEHKDDYDYCEEHCKEYEKSFGSYGVSYVMNFICEEFKPDNVHEIYLVCKKENHENYIFVNFKPMGHGFGEKHSLPYGVSLEPEFVDKTAKNLTMLLDEETKIVKPHIIKKDGKKTIHIFECIENEGENGEWQESASYHGDGWYGYTPIDNLKLIDKQKSIERILKLHKDK